MNAYQPQHFHIRVELRRSRRQSSCTNTITSQMVKCEERQAGNSSSLHEIDTRQISLTSKRSLK